MNKNCFTLPLRDLIRFSTVSKNLLQPLFDLDIKLPAIEDLTWSYNIFNMFVFLNLVDLCGRDTQ